MNWQTLRIYKIGKQTKINFFFFTLPPPLCKQAKKPSASTKAKRATPAKKRKVKKEEAEDKTHSPTDSSPAPKKKKREARPQLPKDVVCDQCGFATTTDQKLDDHVKRVHLNIRYLITTFLVFSLVSFYLVRNTFELQYSQMGTVLLLES